MSEDIKVSVQRPGKEPLLVYLNPNNDLATVRIELEKRIFNMNTLVFAEKNDDGFSEINPVNEKSFILNKLDDVIKCKILYLRKDTTPDWRFFNSLHKLDYGCTVDNDEIKRVSNRAFVMDNCKWIGDDNDNVFRAGKIRYNSNEDWLMKSNLYVTTSVKVQDFVKLGLFIGKSEREESEREINSTYQFTEYRKLFLNFKDHLKPTDEFIGDVKDALESRNPEKFERIIKKFGQFIPTEVIMGGRVYYEDYSKRTETSSENSKKLGAKADVKAVGIEIEKNNENAKGISENYSYECKEIIGLIGGDEPDSCEHFDDKAWVKSLEDHQTWGCIGFRALVSIFTLLPKEMHKQIFQLVGKKVLYSNTIDHGYWLRGGITSETVKLRKLFPDISNILENKESDFNIFTTVVDSEESSKIFRRNKRDKEFFTCQIYQPAVEDPQLVIHCIQPKFRERECKLKIGIMIVGYDTDLNLNLNTHPKLKIIEKDYGPMGSHNMFETEVEYNPPLNGKFSCIGIPVLYDELSSSSLAIENYFFNVGKKDKIGAGAFSYCLKERRHVSLPKCTLTMLIVSDYPNSDAFGKTSLKHINSSFNPKYISLYFENENKCPFFLKRNLNETKVKTPPGAHNCNVYAGKVSNTTIQCSFFDPNNS